MRPILEYDSPVWSGCTLFNEELLESVQLSAARIVTGIMHNTSNATLYEETGWYTLARHRETTNLTLMYKLINKLTPEPLYSIVSGTPHPVTPT